MGCSPSFPTQTQAGLWKVLPSKPMSTTLRLDDYQKQILKESWEVFAPKKVAIGRKMFVNLFKVYPEMQDIFPEFRGAGSIQNIEETQFLNGHSKRLMTALENSVAALDDTYAHQNYMEELGRRHKTRKLKDKYLERMGAALITTFQESFPEKWNADLERAWCILFRITANMMIKGLKNS